MKRFFAIFVLLIFIVCTAAAAETVDESFYIGTWVCFFHLPDGGFAYFLFDLAQDHTACVSLRSVNADLESSGRDNIKTWWAEGNDLHVITGNTTWDLFVTSDYRLAERIIDDYYYIFEKVGGSEGK